MTADERLARLEAYVLPRGITRTEAFRWVDEHTPIGVIKVLNDFLRQQDELFQYASLARLDDTEDMQDVG